MFGKKDGVAGSAMDGAPILARKSVVARVLGLLEQAGDHALVVERLRFSQILTLYGPDAATALVRRAKVVFTPANAEQARWFLGR